MTKKELLYTAISGITATLLTLTVTSLPPLNAQDEPQDITADTIRCKRILLGDGAHTQIFAGSITVFGKDGGLVAIGSNAYGGQVRAWSKGMKGSAELANNAQGGMITAFSTVEDSGYVKLANDEHGGRVHIYGKDAGGYGVDLGIAEHGGEVRVWGKGKHTGSAELSMTEHGGRVQVWGKGSSTAVMGINEYGNRAVSTWDKHGYRLATLK